MHQNMQILNVERNAMRKNKLEKNRYIYDIWFLLVDPKQMLVKSRQVDWRREILIDWLLGVLSKSKQIYASGLTARNLDGQAICSCATQSLYGILTSNSRQVYASLVSCSKFPYLILQALKPYLPASDILSLCSYICNIFIHFKSEWPLKTKEDVNEILVRRFSLLVRFRRVFQSTQDDFKYHIVLILNIILRLRITYITYPCLIILNGSGRGVPRYKIDIGMLMESMIHFLGVHLFISRKGNIWVANSTVSDQREMRSIQLAVYEAAVNHMICIRAL